MQISETQFKKLPDHLKHLFTKLPNPGSDEVLQAFPHTGPTPGSYETSHRDTTAYSGSWPERIVRKGHKDAGGSAARFFYCAKASKRDRNEGCEELPLKVAGGMSGRRDGSMGSTTYNNNTHPTVKPTDLMRYLCRLVTPAGGTVLDPFMGSGSTGKAAVLEGFGFIGIEREAEYAAIAEARIAHAAGEAKQHGLFEDVALCTQKTSAQ
jgi:site-specific DNA-methyltransferase (adenine-specific)